MIWQMELSPAERNEMELALSLRLRQLWQEARATEDPRLAELLNRRAAVLDRAIKALRDAEAN